MAHRVTGAILWIPAQAWTNDSRTGNSVISAGSAWNKFISNTMYNILTQNSQNTQNLSLGQALRRLARWERLNGEREADERGAEVFSLLITHYSLLITLYSVLCRKKLWHDIASYHSWKNIYCYSM